VFLEAPVVAVVTPSTAAVVVFKAAVADTPSTLSV